jgi:hypothetical protein
MNDTTITLHPTLAKKIAAAVTSRSVAATMIDVELRAKPFNHHDFAYWVEAHREASLKLCSMGIDVITYDEQTQQAPA